MYDPLDPFYCGSESSASILPRGPMDRSRPLNSFTLMFLLINVRKVTPSCYRMKFPTLFKIPWLSWSRWLGPTSGIPSITAFSEKREKKVQLRNAVSNKNNCDLSRRLCLRSKNSRNISSHFFHIGKCLEHLSHCLEDRRIGDFRNAAYQRVIHEIYYRVVAGACAVNA